MAISDKWLNHAKWEATYTAGLSAIGLPAVVASLSTAAGKSALRGNRVAIHYFRKSLCLAAKIKWLNAAGYTVSETKHPDTRRRA